jgi:hypothetical protein
MEFNYNNNMTAKQSDEYKGKASAGNGAEIWHSMVRQNLIPDNGKTRLSAELIASILRIEREMFPSESAEVLLMNQVSDSANAASVIYTTYVKWMPKEVEVTPEFIDKVITDRMDFVLNMMAQLLQKAAGRTPKPIQETQSHKYLMTANRCEAEGNDADALSFMDKSVICRDNIEPIIRRGMYFHERNKMTEATEDFSFAIDDAKKTDHRLAFAYAERGLLNIELSNTPQGLNDLLHSFELFEEQIRVKHKIDEDEDSYIGTIEYFMEKAEPVLKTLKTSETLSRNDESKLKALNDLIAAVKEEIETEE